MTKLFTPYDIYNDVYLWLDGQDPANNDGSGVPDSGKIVNEWMDKSKNGINFTVPFPAYNNPQYMQKQIVSLNFTGGSGYTDGEKIEFKLQVTTGAGRSPVYVNLTVSGGAVTSVNSIGPSYGYSVGDRLVEVTDSNSGSTNAIFTVSAVNNVGGFYHGATSTFDHWQSAALTESISHLEIFFVCTPRTRNVGVSMLSLDDSSSANAGATFLSDDSVAGKVDAGMTYTGSNGQDITASVNIDSNVPHIFHYSLSESETNEFGRDAVTSGQNLIAANLPAAYTWRVMNGENVGAFNSSSNGGVYEVLIFNKPLGDNLGRVYGYLEHKYKLDTLPDGHLYKNSPPETPEPFNGAHKLSPREPVQIVKMYLDFCDNTFASSAFPSTCTASGDISSACFNTRFTCQDLDNYRVSSAGRKVYNFTGEVGPSLTGQITNINQCLISVTSAPVEIKPTKGVSVRASVTIKLRDFFSNGATADKYFRTRVISSDRNGSFFTKLIQRNPHYLHRPIEVYDGYIDHNGVAQIADGKRSYLIDSMQLKNDILTVKCKDPMSLADDLKAKVPQPSKFSLKVDLGHGTSSATVLKIDTLDATAAQLQSYFGTSGYVRIEEEIMAYTRAEDAATMSLHSGGRGAWGTKALISGETYDAGEVVQKCISYGDYNGSGDVYTINDVAYDLLVNQAGISPSLINNTLGGPNSWASEKADWLSAYRVDAIFSEPSEINSQLSELGTMTGVNFFYDDLSGQIVMKAETPVLDGTKITSVTDEIIIENSMQVEVSEKERISRVYYYFNIRNHTKGRTAPKNYRQLFIAIDSDGELPIEYGKESSKTIYGYGIQDISTATSVSQRLLARFKETPKTVRFRLDASNINIKTGDHFYLSTADIVDNFGNINTIEMQCLSVKFDTKKLEFEVVAKQFRFALGVAAGIAPNDVAPFSAGGGDGTNASPYTGDRQSNAYLSDGNRISLDILDQGNNFQSNQSIEFKPDESQTGAVAGSRNLAVTYSQSSGRVTQITGVTSNAASGVVPSIVHDGYGATEILSGSSSSGSGLNVRSTKRARFSGGQESYVVS
jgi:hypothetical protein